MGLTATPYTPVNNGAGGAESLHVLSPGDEVNPETLFIAVAINGGATVPVNPPNGWGQIVRVSQGTNVSLLVFGHAANATETFADIVFTFGGQTVEATAMMWKMTSDLGTEQGQARIGFSASATTASGTSHNAPAANAQVAIVDLYSPIMVCLYALKDTAVGNAWTAAGSMTEDSEDITPGVGISLMGAQEYITASGTTGVRTATSSASKPAAVVTLFILEGGIQQPLGSGTVPATYLQDDARSYDSLGFNEVELAASYPANCEDRGIRGGMRCYDVSLALFTGDQTSDTTKTTWRASAPHIFAHKIGALQAANRDYTSWHVEAGTKFENDEGDEFGKGGSDVHQFAQTSPLRGNVKWYGQKITVGAVAFQYLPSAAVDDSEIIDCDWESGGGTIILGDVTFKLNKVKGCQFRNNASTFCANVFAAVCENNAWIGNPSGYMQIGASSAFGLRNCRFAGTPGLADVRVTGAFGNSKFVAHRWSNNKEHFEKTAGTPTVTKANANKEYIILELLARSAGVIQAGIPVRWVDSEGTTQFDVVTDVNGRLVFGSGNELNAVRVRDDYFTSGVKVRDVLDSGTLYINDGAGSNPAFAAQVVPITWTGVDYGFGKQYEGTYFLIVELAAPVVAASSVPLLVSDLPLAAEGVQRILAVVPQDGG